MAAATPWMPREATSMPAEVATALARLASANALAPVMNSFLWPYRSPRCPAMISVAAKPSM